MINNLRVIIITIITACLFTAIVFLEVIATFVAYILLRGTDESFFSSLVTFSRDFLNMFASTLETFLPSIAHKANSTLLGELSPKAVLLLLVGLSVGAILRFVFWGIRCYMRKDVSIG